MAGRIRGRDLRSRQPRKRFTKPPSRQEIEARRKAELQRMRDQGLRVSSNLQDLRVAEARLKLSERKLVEERGRLQASRGFNVSRQIERVQSAEGEFNSAKREVDFLGPKLAPEKYGSRITRRKAPEKRGALDFLMFWKW